MKERQQPDKHIFFSHDFFYLHLSSVAHRTLYTCHLSDGEDTETKPPAFILLMTSLCELKPLCQTNTVTNVRRINIQQRVLFSYQCRSSDLLTGIKTKI